MLQRIHTLAEKARTELNRNLSFQSKDKEIKALIAVYDDIIFYIDSISNENATVGSCFLAWQLGLFSYQLNAFDLGKNFLRVLDFKPNEVNTWYDFFRFFSIFYLEMKIVSLIIFTVPWILLLGASPLYLVAPLFWPLLIYGLFMCFDEPYSLSRLYHEMSSVLSSLCYLILITGICSAVGLSLSLLIMTGIPLLPMVLWIGVSLISMLSFGCVFSKCTNMTEAKEIKFKNDVSDMKRELEEHSDNLHAFFNIAQTNTRSYQKTSEHDILLSLF